MVYLVILRMVLSDLSLLSFLPKSNVLKYTVSHMKLTGTIGSHVCVPLSEYSATSLIQSVILCNKWLRLTSGSRYRQDDKATLTITLTIGHMLSLSDIRCYSAISNCISLSKYFI